MQQGTLVGSYGRAVQDAANNANGAATGMMGVGMVNMASGGVMGGAMNNAFTGQGVTVQDLQNQQAANGAAAGVAATTGAGTFCPNCGNRVDGAKFCSNCGAKLGE